MHIFWQFTGLMALGVVFGLLVENWDYIKDRFRGRSRRFINVGR